MGAAGHLHRLHLRLHRRGRHLRGGLLPGHRHLEQRRLHLDRAGRRDHHRHPRLRRHPRRHALAAGHGGHLGDADRDPDDRHRGQAHRRHLAARDLDHASTPSSSPAARRCRAVGSAAVFGFLSFAGFEGAASLGEETDNPRREIPRAIRNAVLATGRLLHPVHPGPDVGLRRHRHRRQGVRRLERAARRPRAHLHRRVDGGLHQRRRDHQRLRQRPGRVHRGRADPVRAEPRHALRGVAGTDLDANRRPRRRPHRGAHLRRSERSRRSGSPASTRSTRSSIPGRWAC